MPCPYKNHPRRLLLKTGQDPIKRRLRQRNHVVGSPIVDEKLIVAQECAAGEYDVREEAVGLERSGRHQNRLATARNHAPRLVERSKEGSQAIAIIWIGGVVD